MAKERPDASWSLEALAKADRDEEDRPVRGQVPLPEAGLMLMKVRILARIAFLEREQAHLVGSIRSSAEIHGKLRERLQHVQGGLVELTQILSEEDDGINQDLERRASIQVSPGGDSEEEFPERGEGDTGKEAGISFYEGDASGSHRRRSYQQQDE